MRFIMDLSVTIAPIVGAAEVRQVVDDQTQPSGGMGD